MTSSPLSTPSDQPPLKLRICRRRRGIWMISGFVISISLLGFVLCFLNPSIGLPLRPGLDFTGGTQIELQRSCLKTCEPLTTNEVLNVLTAIELPVEAEKLSPNLSASRVQLLEGGKSLLMRLPLLSAFQAKNLLTKIEPLLGPFDENSIAINTIGPSLGGQLLKSSLVSLMAAFGGIAVYISLRYDRRFAFFALVALAHDVIIVCGLFAWLGLLLKIEVNSLFAVALLTIAGYSVNDTVVVFDRIRERRMEDASLPTSEQIDRAVSSTITRTLYTSGTTLLPLVALMIFGGATLFWFAVALSSGVIIGSWSSIALAPSFLSLKKGSARSFLVEEDPKESPG